MRNHEKQGYGCALWCEISLTWLIPQRARRENAMPTTSSTHPSIQPIVCAPWCTDGDGHANEHFSEDQTCWGAATYVALSREDADVDLGGRPYPARVGAMAHRESGSEPVVYLHTELHGFKNIDTAAHLTAQEARALADALTTAADEVDGTSMEGSA